MNLLRFALKKAAKKPAPERIWRSGPFERGLDCYSVNFSGEGEIWRVLFDQVCHEGIIGRWFDGEKYQYSCCIPWSKLEDATCEFIHYIGPYKFIHNTLYGFLINELLCIPRFRILLNIFEQFVFNRRRLVRTERMTALKYILERTFEDRNFGTSAGLFMVQVHSERSLYHPDRDQHIFHSELLLDSLVESGDLKKDGALYRLTPKALMSIAAYEEEDRRHRDSLRQQWVLTGLTFVLILVTALPLVLGWMKPPLEQATGSQKGLSSETFKVTQ